jgi:hypothetical protein
MSDMRLEYEEALHLSNIWHARWIWARGQADRPYTMTPAKLRLAQAAMAKRDTKVGDLCKELGVTRRCNKLSDASAKKKIGRQLGYRGD